MTRLPPHPDLNRLSHAEKDTLIMALWTRVSNYTFLARFDSGLIPDATPLSGPAPIPSGTAGRYCISS